jgi:hypothetical protein
MKPRRPWVHGLPQPKTGPHAVTTQKHVSWWQDAPRKEFTARSEEHFPKPSSKEASR